MIFDNHHSHSQGSLYENIRRMMIALSIKIGPCPIRQIWVELAGSPDLGEKWASLEGDWPGEYSHKKGDPAEAYLVYSGTGTPLPGT